MIKIMNPNELQAYFGRKPPFKILCHKEFPFGTEMLEVDLTCTGVMSYRDNLFFLQNDGSFLLIRKVWVVALAAFQIPTGDGREFTAGVFTVTYGAGGNEHDSFAFTFACNPL